MSETPPGACALGGERNRFLRVGDGVPVGVALLEFDGRYVVVVSSPALLTVQAAWVKSGLAIFPGLGDLRGGAVGEP